MKELVDKMVKLGLGAFDLTEETAKGVVEDLIRRGELRKEEGQHLLGEIMEKGKSARSTVEEMVNQAVQCAFEKIDFVRKEDLEKVMAEFEKRMEEKFSNQGTKEEKK